MNAHFQDVAGSVSLLFLNLEATNISWMDVCNQSEHKLPRMQS